MLEKQLGKGLKANLLSRAESMLSGLITHSVLTVFFNFLLGFGVLTINCGVYFRGDNTRIQPFTTIDLKTDIYIRCTVEGEGFPDLDMHFAYVEATTADNLNSEDMIFEG